MRYLFMGSPPIAANILTGLVEAGYPPLAVVTQPPRASGRGQKLRPTAVENYAKEQGVEVLAVEKASSPEVVEKISSFQPDVILVVAFGQILKQSLLDVPKLFCLNIHASLLPKYRGAAPVQYAIWNGDTETGVTVQKMILELDAGDIFVQEKTQIKETETSGELLKRLEGLGTTAALKAFKKIEAKDLSFTPQDPGQVSLAPKIKKEQALIDWNLPAKTIGQQIRALQPWPVAETQAGNLKIKVLKGEVTNGLGKAPGEIDTDSKSYLKVQCGEQALLLTEIQPENRKKLHIEDFLRGYPITTNRLGTS